MTSQQIKKYCEAEFKNINIVLSELFTVVKVGKQEYSKAELAAIATFVHNFYNGVENILKRILLYKKTEIKDTSTWHKDMLRISSEKEIITKELSGVLSMYLSFRHFFVHSYSFILEWKNLKPLVDDIKETFNKFKSVIYEYIKK